MLQLACTYHGSSEGIHIDKLFYRQVLKNVLRQLFFSSKHCTNITYSKSFKKWTFQVWNHKSTNIVSLV